MIKTVFEAIFEIIAVVLLIAALFIEIKWKAEKLLPVVTLLWAAVTFLGLALMFS